jgi:hypothetical protein
VDLIIGSIVGIIAGYVCAITPGLSVMSAIWIAGLVGLLFPAAYSYAITAAIGMYLLSSSAKESLTPHLAGDEKLSSAMNEEFSNIDPRSWVKQINNGKCIGIILGISIGVYCPHVFSSMLFTWGALGLIILFCSSEHKAAAVGLFIFVQVAFLICNMTGVQYPVTAIASCMFLVPAALRFKKMQANGTNVINVPTDGVKLVGAGLLSFFSPGVSSFAAINSSSKKAGLTSMLVVLITNTFAEAYTIALLASGVTSSKAISGIELAGSNVSMSHVLVFLAAAFIGLSMQGHCFDKYVSVIKSYKFSYLVALVTGVATCVVSCGVLAFLLIPAGIGIDLWLNKVNAPATVRSLVFLGPVLF